MRRCAQVHTCGRGGALFRDRCGDLAGLGQMMADLSPSSTAPREARRFEHPLSRWIFPGARALAPSTCRRAGLPQAVGLHILQRASYLWAHAILADRAARYRRC